MKIKVLKSNTEWAKLRTKFVTATDAASILGLNPFSSANKMWKEKEHSTFTGNAFTEVGQLLEPIVVQITNKKLKAQFKLFEEEHKGKVIFYKEDLRVSATPDGFNEKGQLLECKTTKPAKFLQYKKSPPLMYLMQVQIQLLCTEFKEAYLSILSTDLTQTSPILNYPIAIYKVFPCQELIELYLKELNRFFKCQQDGKKFRVNTKSKLRACLLLHSTWSRG